MDKHGIVLQQENLVAAPMALKNGSMALEMVPWNMVTLDVSLFITVPFSFIVLRLAQPCIPKVEKHMQSVSLPDQFYSLHFEELYTYFMCLW